jgi:hypothetical protein
MAKLKYTLIACVDCIAFVANGDIPEDRPELAKEIHDHMGLEPGDHLVNADGTDENGDYHKDSNGDEIDMDHPEYEAIREEWFSWRACECCGSTLGGNRNRLAVLCN